MMLDDAALRELLTSSETLAVYGMSRDPRKAAHRVPRSMLAYGFDVIPINPYAEAILGRPCYRGLLDIPGRVDIVNVFRPSAEALAVVKEALRRRAQRGDVALIWLQLGIRNAQARRLAHAAGVPFVQDRCMAVEVPRLLG
jgi:hypothetical protein